MKRIGRPEAERLAVTSCLVITALFAQPFTGTALAAQEDRTVTVAAHVVRHIAERQGPQTTGEYPAAPKVLHLRSTQPPLRSASRIPRNSFPSRQFGQSSEMAIR